MNEFNAVSMDELTEVEGGSILGKIGAFVEKVAVAVATAILVKKLS